MLESMCVRARREYKCISGYDFFICVSLCMFECMCVRVYASVCMCVIELQCM